MTLLQQLILIIKKIAVLRRKLLHQAALNYLGTDASPADLVDDVLGCAESVSHVIRKVFPDFPIITGTWTLERKFWHDKRFVPTTIPKPGDIVISPTGSSKLGRNAPIRGHVGIVGENGIIMSNDSYTGKWMANYTLVTWKKRYVEKGGYRMFFYTISENI